MRRYLTGTLIISLVLILVYYYVKNLTDLNVFHKQFPTLVFFFFFQSLAVSWLFYLGEKAKWESPIYALAAMTFRFLTGLGFLLILFVMKPENIKPLMLQFMGLYLVYLIFELFVVLPNLRRN